MSRSAKRAPRKRAYASELRRDQAEATRARIIDGFIEQWRSEPEALSIAAVARRARVAVPTIYRHFPTRVALLDAARRQVEAAYGPVPAYDPRRIEPLVRTFFDRQARMSREFREDDSALIWQMRREVTVPERRAGIEQLIDLRVPGLAGSARTWLSDLLVVLISSVSASAFRNYVGCDADATADRVLWAVDALLEHARRTGAKGRTAKAARATNTKAKARGR